MAIMTDGVVPVPGDRHRAPGEHDHPAPPDRADRAARRSPRARTDLRPHPKGRVFDLRHRPCTPAASWCGRRPARSCAPAGGDRDAPAERARRARAPAPAGGIAWRLPGDLGRRYAAVSGDHNPIHLYPLTAKAFGFPRQIAHGMWSKARCLAALEGRLPDAVTRRRGVQEAGAAARHGARSARAREDDGYDVLADRPKDGAPHLVGRFGPANI